MKPNERRRLIDWLDAKARTWGHAKRRLLFAAERYPQSFAGKCVEEGAGAAIGRAMTKPTGDIEVFTGDALEVAVALHRALEDRNLTDRQYECFFVHYVIKAPTKVKRHDLGIEHRTYYDHIAAAHHKLADYMGDTQSAVFTVCAT